jgi:hypothetical protein
MIASLLSSALSQYTCLVSQQKATFNTHQSSLKQRSNSPLSPSKIMLDQIIKGHCISLRHTALLAQENANPRGANEKKRQKSTRPNRRIVHEGGLSFEEGLQLAQQLNQPVEGDGVVYPTQSDLLTQQDQPGRRALLRCSGCGRRLVIRLINVKIASLRLFDILWLRYPDSKFSNGGG